MARACRTSLKNHFAFTGSLMVEKLTMTYRMQGSGIKPTTSSDTNLILRTNNQVNHHGETIHYVGGMYNIGEQ